MFHYKLTKQLYLFSQYISNILISALQVNFFEQHNINQVMYLDMSRTLIPDNGPVITWRQPVRIIHHEPSLTLCNIRYIILCH